MADLIVDMSMPQAVIVGATGLGGIAQEIRTVLATRKGSVPLDRDFGLSWDFVDMPQPMAMQQMVAEIGQQLERYVPRIRVVDISFSATADAACPTAGAFVSIHAPARGATPCRCARARRAQVSIHAPARGATRPRASGRPWREVSIHAPARGATSEGEPYDKGVRSFNPRAREGRDCLLLIVKNYVCLHTHFRQPSP